MCGGVGEWQYEYLAGITPTSPGYATVKVKPLVSKTLGPSSVAAAVTTVRGVVRSNWTRIKTLSAGGDLGGVAAGTRLLSLEVAVPDAVQTAEVHVPLLDFGPHQIRVRLGGEELACQDRDRPEAALLWPEMLGCWTDKGADGDDVMVVSLTSWGVFEFTVEAR